MKCTAPCQPKCDQEATHELRSAMNTFMGYNCDKHLAPLQFGAAGGKADYIKVPLVPVAEGEA